MAKACSEGFMVAGGGQKVTATEIADSWQHHATLASTRCISAPMQMP
jgi:hypothetical protein